MRAHTFEKHETHACVNCVWKPFHKIIISKFMSEPMQERNVAYVSYVKSHIPLQVDCTNIRGGTLDRNHLYVNYAKNLLRLLTIWNATWEFTLVLILNRTYVTCVRNRFRERVIWKFIWENTLERCHKVCTVPYGICNEGSSTKPFKNPLCEKGLSRLVSWVFLWTLITGRVWNSKVFCNLVWSFPFETIRLGNAQQPV